MSELDHHAILTVSDMNGILDGCRSLFYTHIDTLISSNFQLRVKVRSQEPFLRVPK